MTGTLQERFYSRRFGRRLRLSPPGTTHESIEADVAAFIASGKSIQQVETGATNDEQLHRIIQKQAVKRHRPRPRSDYRGPKPKQQGY